MSLQQDSSVDPLQRCPGLSPAGAALLKRMRELPCAPIYRNQSGHRLGAGEVAAVRAHAAALAHASIEPRAAHAAWLPEFFQRVRERVPAQHVRDADPTCFESWPTTCRADFAADIAAHVPDDLPLDRLINFRTTGTSGHPLLLPSHPVVAARYLGYHQRAFRRFGIELTAGRGAVGVVLIGWQERCFTYTSVSPYRDECGLAKINLHPADWRDPAHRGAYLDALAPEVIAGDPLSFAELLQIPCTHRPRVLLSTSMQLLPGLRRALAARFACPIADIYSMNEAGPIAVADSDLGGHVLLQPEMVVEILDPDGRPLPEGERGEITLSGGFNDYLPLLRYRTGDHASLVRREGEWLLLGLEGRQPVRFRRSDGRWINNIDVTHALRDWPLAQFALHQHADGSFDLGIQSAAALDHAQLQACLLQVLGDQARLRIASVAPQSGKLWQYRCDLPA